MNIFKHTGQKEAYGWRAGRMRQIFPEGFAFCCILFFFIAVGGSCRQEQVFEKTQLEAFAPIVPDYADSIVLPVNIAPLNFCIRPDSAFFARGRVQITAYDSLQENKLSFVFPLKRVGGTSLSIKRWKKLMRQASGGHLEVEIALRAEGGTWKVYRKLHWRVSPQPIDRYLLFRASQYEEGVHGELYIAQRDLQGFDNVYIGHNRLMDGNCMNCHDCGNNDASNMVFHLREAHKGTILMQGDSIMKISVPAGYNLRFTYPAWHPSQKIIAFSTNLPHSVHYSNSVQKLLYTLDTLGSLVFLDLEKMEIFSCPELTDTRYEQVFPTWSPDGKTLYFCRSPRNEYGRFPFPQYVDSSLSMRQNRVEQIWDDLMQMDFDLETRRFSNLRCTYPFSDLLHKSASMPKVSREGRYLLVSLLKATTFPLQNLGDFYMLDLADTLSLREVYELNTPGSEKGHSFSSSGNWMVFSSSRRTLAVPETYITHFDTSTGCFSKPFLVPQKRGDFYCTNLKGFVFPVLSTKPSVYKAWDVARVAKGEAKEVKVDTSLFGFRLKEGQVVLSGGH